MRRRPSRPAAAPLGARTAIAALAAAAAVLASAVAAAQTVRTEVQVTTAAIPDNEYDTARKGIYCSTCNFGDGNARFAFSDHLGNLWLAHIDYRTGAFVPADGHGLLIDTNTAPVSCFGNGPEWVASANGSQIVYTRFVDSTPFQTTPADCNAAQTEVVVATQTANGWTTAALPNSLGRSTPEGTLDENDTDPRVDYIESDKSALFWRRLSAPGVENPLPIDQLTGGNSRRWVPGTRKIIFQGHRVEDPRLLDQVYTFDTDTNELEQLTFDSVSKAGGFMWRAPEYGNEYVFFTMANFRREIWVYRKLKGAGGKMLWTIVKKVKGPKQLPFFFSPEPFTHNGRSYIFTEVSSSSKFFDKSIPNQLGMSGIDPLRADFRMLTNDSSIFRLRLDPEVFVTAQGPFVYYNRLVPATDQFPDGINDGVWRVDTGLGPPKF